MRFFFRRTLRPGSALAVDGNIAAIRDREGGLLADPMRQEFPVGSGDRPIAPFIADHELEQMEGAPLGNSTHEAGSERVGQTGLACPVPPTRMILRRPGRNKVVCRGRSRPALIARMRR